VNLLSSQTLEQGQFELYTSFQGINLQDGAESINFCTAADDGIDTIYLIDQDGSLRPASVPTTGPATLVSNGPQIKKFVESGKCTEVTAGCYSYCHDTCFRSVRYEVEVPGTANYMLKVCRSGDSAECALFAGSLRDNPNRNANDRRTFIAHLPVGSTYNAVFLNNSGNEIELSSAVAEYEESFCPGGEFEVSLHGELPADAPVGLPHVVAPVALPPVVAPVALPPVASGTAETANKPANWFELISWLFTILFGGN